MTTARPNLTDLPTLENPTVEETLILVQDSSVNQTLTVTKARELLSAPGPQGAQGRQGNQGIQGLQGSQGIQGSQGVQGAQGYQGHQGNQGFQGIQGAQGVQGAQGFQGRQGVQGEKGVQGAQGFQGRQGVQGEKGAQGEIGAQGNQGYQGNTVINTTATDLAGGDLGSIPIQKATSSTTFIPIGATGTILVSQYTTASWVSTGSITVELARNADNLYVTEINSPDSDPFYPTFVKYSDAYDAVYTTATVEFNDVLQTVKINSPTLSNSTQTGALVVTGGVGIGGDLYVEGDITAKKLTIEYTTITQISVETDDVVTITDDTESTGTDTGALIVAGGVGIGKRLNVGAGITAQTFNKVDITAPATASTLTISDAKTISFPQSLTFPPNDGTSTYVLATDGAGVLSWVSPLSGAQGGTGAQGEIGAQGHQGVQGEIGAQGHQGHQGHQGVQGAQGHQGVQGEVGVQGNQGVQGAGGVGTQGSDGAQGAQGHQGHQGVQGAQGVQGEIGAQGHQGHQGVGFQGETGIQGAQGHQGVQGTTGAQGATGAQGSVGAQGEGGIGTQGAQGAPGAQGAKGDTTLGAQGHQGVQGAEGGGAQGSAGAQGNQGVQGAKGAQGEVGAQGHQGHQGVQGAQGHQGHQGVQGAQGHQGHQGVQGAQGVQGEKGAQGTQGHQGHQGVQGTQGESLIKSTAYKFNTKLTATHPGAGYLNYNSATPSSVTTIYFAHLDQNTTDQSAWLDTWDDNIAERSGLLSILNTSNVVLSSFRVTGTNGVSSGGGNTTYAITVQHVGGSTLPTSNQDVIVKFSITGSVGAQGTQGVQGTIGAQGNQGVQGAPSAGIQGSQGVQGSSGATLTSLSANQVLYTANGSSINGTNNFTYTAGSGLSVDYESQSQLFVDQDTSTAPYFTSKSQTGSSYVPVAKIKTIGTSITRISSFGNLHNLDGSIYTTIHAINNGDSSNYSWYFQNNGDFVSPGNVTAYSDARLKDNVETLSSALSKVLRLRGVSYTKDGVDGIGLIAQEVQKIIPQVVNEASDDNKTLSVAYGNLVGLLIEAIKELNEKIERLENKK